MTLSKAPFLKSLLPIAATVSVTLFATACQTLPQSYSDFTPLAMAETNEIERVFVNGAFGDIHVRIMKPGAEKIEQTPLILFHPSPYSGEFFIPFMTRMATDRIVIAIDTPGYGDSTRPPEPQSVQNYAEALADGLDALGLGKSFDVLGYHTGTLIAAEMALARPNRVRRLVLPGVPYFVGEAREEAYKRNAKETILSEDGSHLLDKWGLAAIAVKNGRSLLDAQALYSDMMQSYPYDWWAYHGVFSYEGENRLPLIKQATRVISVTGSLQAESKAAADMIPNGEYLLLENVEHGLFDLHLDDIEKATREFLDAR